MEIFTKELATEFLKTMAETLYSLSSSILGALWQSATGFFPSMFAAIWSHDWGNVALHATILLAIIVLVYRLARRRQQIYY